MLHDEAHITTIAVHPDHQRTGLGQLLLTGLADAAEERQCRGITLEVRVGNESAIAFYEKNGFVSSRGSPRLLRRHRRRRHHHVALAER